MPISEKQLKILAFPYSGYQALICDGSIRSGKTSLMTVAFVDWMMREYDRQHFIVLGHTVGSAVRNVIDPYMATTYAQGRYGMHFASSAGVLTVSGNGRENYVHVFGADNARSFQKIQGMTAAGLLVDEVALCERSAVEQAMARCSVTGSRYWFNCNPDSPRHWFYEQWILRAAEMNALHLHFTLDDNPGLSQEVIDRYNRQYHGVFHDRYIKGLWVVAEGLVYQLDGVDFKCTREEAVGQGEWYVSCDYGITNPFCALLWRVTPDRAYVVDEYYFDSRREGRRKTDAEHMDAVERLCAGRNIEALVVDPSATSFKEEAWRRCKLDVWDADNSVLDGIAVTDQMLHNGSIVICEECADTIGELGMYRWDDRKARDSVIKEHDHAMDAMRYMAQTVLKDALVGFAW
jgi:PBSX family phage terminase large subunit